MDHKKQLALRAGDCRDVLLEMRSAGGLFDACVTDPPYELGFMGKAWDQAGVAFDPATWRAVHDVLKPGAFLVAFGGTRTFHRMAVAIEDAGFEVRDTLMWLYGTGFPKSHDVSKGIDKAAGATREVVGSNPNHRAVSGVGYEGVYAGGNTGAADVTAPATEAARQWRGWGTALKPAWEPIILARKPLVGTVVANVLAHGTGALNIDACRIATSENLNGGAYSDGARVAQAWSDATGMMATGGGRLPGAYSQPEGRWPANVLHDGSDEVLEAFAAYGEKKSGELHPWHDAKESANGSMAGKNYAGRVKRSFGGDSGSAARFFYSAKATAADRAGSSHPTVKPIALIRYLMRLVTQPGGHVLDPFAGSGTTLAAAHAEGFHATGIEREVEYQADIRRRITELEAEDLADWLKGQPPAVRKMFG